jgi:DNA polymerase-3 subunit epsilon
LNQEQFSPGLFPELPVPQPKITVKKRMVRAPSPTAATSGVSAAPDPEAMAKLLELHADFRVHRRLQPCLLWPGASATSVTRVVVLDTETTGLDASREAIIELALLRVDVDSSSGLPVGAVRVFDQLEDPGKPIPPEVVALTGITDAQVHGQRLDETGVQDMMKDVDVVIAHNAAFDRPFVEARFPFFAKLRWACSFADIDWKAQGRSSSKLESLAQAMGLFYDAHRAEMDCHALLAVLAAPLPMGGETALARLIHSASSPSFRLSATNAPFESKDRLKARAYRWNGDQRVWQTRLSDQSALEAESAWLKEVVYNGRSAVIQVEKLDARTKYSTRPGDVSHRQL